MSGSGADKRDRLKAWFLGPGGNQGALFQELAGSILTQYVDLRKKEQIQTAAGSPDGESVASLKGDLHQLVSQLNDSLPSYSPRFLGNLVSEQSLPGMLGLMAGMLYNQNNISSDYGPATVPMELEVGRQFSDMIGYDPATAWCHLSPSNILANLEALWVARTLKYLPFAAERVAAEKGVEVEVHTAGGVVALLNELSPWELANIPVSAALDMLQSLCTALQKQGGYSEADARKEIGNCLNRYSITGKGLEAFFLDAGGKQWGLRPPVVIVPITYQFNYLRVVDLLGLGRENLRTVQVDSNFRINLNDLARTLRACRERSVPVLGVVSMCGTNLEGAVDNIKMLAELREQFEYDDPSLSFYIHSDASYGAYFRCILRKAGRLVDHSDVAHLMSREVYDGLAHLAKADSVTIDPQVTGYVPYSSAAVAFKDGRMRDVISLRSPYTPVEDDSRRNQFLAQYTIEAVRPAAPTVACWLSNRAIGLEHDGYGLILSQAIEGARTLHKALVSPAFTKRLKSIGMELFEPHDPDLSVLMFMVNRVGNRDLRYMNGINACIHDQLRHDPHSENAQESLIIGRCELPWQDYRHPLSSVVSGLGLSNSDVVQYRVDRLTTLRAAVLTPWLAQLNEAQIQQFLDDLFRAIERVPSYEMWQQAAAGKQ